MFNAKKIKQELIQWIKNWFEQNGPHSPAIIGISGGKDSAIVAALCVEALGKGRVIGISLPQDCHEGESTEDPDVQKLVKHLGISCFTYDIGGICGSILGNIGETFYKVANSQTVENIPPRVRMTYLYALASMCDGRVANCSNLSEDVVGYTTKWGSNTGDFAPIADLTVTEIKLIGKELRLPRKIVEKIPHDGLQSLSDEERLGITYKEIDKWCRHLCNDEKIDKKIVELKKKNAHKFKSIPRYNFS